LLNFLTDFMSDQLSHCQSGGRQRQIHLGEALTRRQPKDNRRHRELHASPEWPNDLCEAERREFLRRWNPLGTPATQGVVGIQQGIEFARWTVHTLVHTL